MCKVDDLIGESIGWCFNFWRSDGDCGFTPGQPFPLEPSRGGAIMRICGVPPDSMIQSMSEAEIQRIFSELGAPAKRASGADHRLMHTTDTIDYIVVLQGEITLHLDNEDIHLKPFDTVVQRATAHAWKNSSNEMAYMLVVLLGQTPDADHVVQAEGVSTCAS